MRLKDKVIIVTGGTSGIGEAIAERAVAEGARVLVHGIERGDGEAVVRRLGAAGALHLDDLVDPASSARIVAAALSAFGRIDAVVNNAAIVARSNLATTSAANFDRMMAVNVRAPLLLIQAAFPHLKANEGCVLNIGSINAHSGQANLLDYSLSKGAMQTLSRNLANAHGTDRVRVNHLNVGWVLTAREYAHQIEHGMPADWPEHVPAQFAPSGRLILPAEIAAAAVYWLGDESRPISGAVVELEQFSVIGRNPNKSTTK
ncbi:MAG: SDR family oxidoreductase [Verrucomicrobia bacterium]|nr:SDR family oxidoreductase [Verrucomicrobiota bacterium]